MEHSVSYRSPKNTNKASFRSGAQAPFTLQSTFSIATTTASDRQHQQLPLCCIAMAAKAVFRLPLASSRVCFELPAASRRTFTTLRPAVRSTPIKQTQQRQTPRLSSRPTLQLAFRRTYAEQAQPPPAPSVNLSPTPKPKKRFRFLRFLWRVTYISTIAGVGYLSFHIWWLRHPPDQIEPDPSKKNLVILGSLTRLTLTVPPAHDD